MDDVDQRVWLHDVPWDVYERLLEIRGEKAVPRIAYDDGELELMTPSQSHEQVGRNLDLLLAMWQLHTATRFGAFGSWTLKAKLKKKGFEPDCCYQLYPVRRRGIPDIVVEVIWTSGAMHKFPIYAALGVREIWIWRNGHFQIWSLRKGDYVRARRSRVLPKLDLELLEKYVPINDRYEAATRYRRALTSRSRSESRR